MRGINQCIDKVKSGLETIDRTTIGDVLQPVSDTINRSRAIVRETAENIAKTRCKLQEIENQAEEIEKDQDSIVRSIDGLERSVEEDKVREPYNRKIKELNRTVDWANNALYLSVVSICGFSAAFFAGFSAMKYMLGASFLFCGYNFYVIYTSLTEVERIIHERNEAVQNME